MPISVQAARAAIIVQILVLLVSVYRVAHGDLAAAIGATLNLLALVREHRKRLVQHEPHAEHVAEREHAVTDLRCPPPHPGTRSRQAARPCAESRPRLDLCD